MNEVTDKREQEQYRKMALAMFKTVDVFSRLAPLSTHQLVGKTMVISGQCHIRAENYQKGQTCLRRQSRARPMSRSLFQRRCIGARHLHETKDFEKATASSSALRGITRLKWRVTPAAV